MKTKEEVIRELGEIINVPDNQDTTRKLREAIYKIQRDAFRAGAIWCADNIDESYYIPKPAIVEIKLKAHRITELPD